MRGIVAPRRISHYWNDDSLYIIFIHLQKSQILSATRYRMSRTPLKPRRSTMSTHQLAEILKISAQNPPPQRATPAMMRAWAEGVTSHTPLAGGVKISRSSFGPYQGDLILPDGGDASRLIIYYHGGGFFLFSSHPYRVTTTNLARVSGSAVFVPDYRLAPENPAPAAHDDAFGVYQWALKQGYAADRIALGGDSAGGNLALATILRARDAGLPLPSALVLFSP